MLVPGRDFSYMYIQWSLLHAILPSELSPTYPDVLHPTTWPPYLNQRPTSHTTHTPNSYTITLYSHHLHINLTTSPSHPPHQSHSIHIQTYFSTLQQHLQHFTLVPAQFSPNFPSTSQRIKHLSSCRGHHKLPLYWVQATLQVHYLLSSKNQSLVLIPESTSINMAIDDAFPYPNLLYCIGVRSKLRVVYRDHDVPQSRVEPYFKGYHWEPTLQRGATQEPLVYSIRCVMHILAVEHNMAAFSELYFAVRWQRRL